VRARIGILAGPPAPAKVEVQELVNAFSVLMKADPVELDHVECQGCRTQEKRKTVPCAHCGKKVCPSCTSQCEDCRDYFCKICSTLSYTQRFERELCLSCFEAESSECKHS